MCGGSPGVARCDDGRGRHRQRRAQPRIEERRLNEAILAVPVGVAVDRAAVEVGDPVRGTRPASCQSTSSGPSSGTFDRRGVGGSSVGGGSTPLVRRIAAHTRFASSSTAKAISSEIGPWRAAAADARTGRARCQFSCHRRVRVEPLDREEAPIRWCPKRPVTSGGVDQDDFGGAHHCPQRCGKRCHVPVVPMASEEADEMQRRRMCCIGSLPCRVARLVLDLPVAATWSTGPIDTTRHRLGLLARTVGTESAVIAHQSTGPPGWRRTVSVDSLAVTVAV